MILTFSTVAKFPTISPFPTLYSHLEDQRTNDAFRQGYEYVKNEGGNSTGFLN